MKKKYQLIHNVSLLTTVAVGKELVDIEFDGGSDRPFLRHGTFITSDEKIQKAIEKRKDFGIQIREVPLSKKEQEEKPQEEKPAGPISPPDDTNEDHEISEDDPLQSYPGITTVQMAKEVLVKDHGVLSSHCRNRADVEKFAKELNITFPDLP